MDNAGRVLTRRMLLESAWGPGRADVGNYLEVHIRRLRTKIESDAGRPTRIRTVHGVGYIFDLPHGEWARRAVRHSLAASMNCSTPANISSSISPAAASWTHKVVTSCQTPTRLLLPGNRVPTETISARPRSTLSVQNFCRRLGPQPLVPPDSMLPDFATRTRRTPATIRPSAVP